MGANGGGETTRGGLEASHDRSEGGGFLPWAWYQATPRLGLPLGHGMKEGGSFGGEKLQNGGFAPERSKMRMEGSH
jgi:hypothetical protein